MEGKSYFSSNKNKQYILETRKEFRRGNAVELHS